LSFIWASEHWLLQFIWLLDMALHQAFIIEWVD
jgi:hypothetical protein